MVERFTDRAAAAQRMHDKAPGGPNATMFLREASLWRRAAIMVHEELGVVDIDLRDPTTWGDYAGDGNRRAR